MSQSSFMRNNNLPLPPKMISSSHKVNQGRVALFGLGLLYLIIAAIPIIRFRVFEFGLIFIPGFLITIVPPILFIGLGLLSLKTPKSSFMIGLVLTGLLFLRSLWDFSPLGIALHIVIGIMLYNGFQGAIALDKKIIPPAQNDRILDSDLD